MTMLHEWLSKQSYCAPRSRIFYVPTPKVACTTIKIALVQLEDAWRRTDSLVGVPASALSHHRRETHSLGSLADLAPERIDEILLDPRWIRFCVTRRPYERLVSAWVDKVFLGALKVSVGNTAIADIDRTPAIGSQFREFVQGLGSDGVRVFENPHFRPQTELLDFGRFPYTHVVKLAELEEFAETIRSDEGTRSGFDLGTTWNGSIKVPLRAMYDRRTAEIVDSLFGADFDALGYERESFNDEPEPFELNTNEIFMVNKIVALKSQLHEMNPARWARLADQRTGVRYGIGEVARSTLWGLRRRSQRK